MKQLQFLFLVITLAFSTLATGLIVHSFPEGTILYKAIGARITSISPIQPGENKGSEQIKFTFSGKWELNPDLQGVTPEASVVIVADTVEKKQQLVKIQSTLSSRKQKTLNIYILSGSVNREGVTYTWPGTIKIELPETAEPNASANDRGGHRRALSFAW